MKMWLFLLFASESKARAKLESLEHDLRRVKENEIPRHLQDGRSINKITLMLENQIAKIKSKLDR